MQPAFSHRTSLLCKPQPPPPPPPLPIHFPRALKSGQVRTWARELQRGFISTVWIWKYRDAVCLNRKTSVTHHAWRSPRWGQTAAQLRFLFLKHLTTSAPQLVLQLSVRVSTTTKGPRLQLRGQGRAKSTSKKTYFRLNQPVSLVLWGFL